MVLAFIARQKQTFSCQAIVTAQSAGSEFVRTRFMQPQRRSDLVKLRRSVGLCWQRPYWAMCDWLLGSVNGGSVRCVSVAELVTLHAKRSASAFGRALVSTRDAAFQIELWAILVTRGLGHVDDFRPTLA